MVQRSTVRRRRQAAEVISVVCRRCGGRGWVYVSDDWSPPREVDCRRCSGRGLIAPPAGSRAAAIVTLATEPAGPAFRAWEDAQDPSPAA